MCRIAFIISLVIISAHTVLGLSGSGTEEEPWRIESLDDFNEFAADANYWAGYTRLETDVNLAGLIYTTAVIAPDIDNTNIVFDGIAFEGVFDGNDHKITNLRIDGGANNDFLGLFGYIEKGGEVKKLCLEGVSIVGTGWYVGGLVGENGGNVSNCYSNAVVRGYNFAGGLVGCNYVAAGISNCHSTGDVSGTWEVGGLVGRNYGHIWGCYSNSSVSGVWIVGGLLGMNRYGYVLDCYSTGVVSGEDNVGGLLGYNQGNVSNCYSVSSVSGHSGVGGLVGFIVIKIGNLSNCYSTGSVTGSDYVGGLVGVNYISISNCRSTGDVSGTVEVGGLVGSNGGSVSNSYSTGDVGGGYRVGGLLGIHYDGTVLNCYSTGDVSGDIDVGGLLGWNYYGIVSNSFWDTEIQTHGVTESIGLDEGGILTNVSGHATAEMQTKSTFTDAHWDFVDIWDLTCEGMNYPRFIWQITPVDFLCPHGVDFRDYSFFSGYWGDTNCVDANDCDGTDFDLSGTVDMKDIDIFCGYWLSGVDG